MLGQSEYRDYGNRLTTDAALAGKNFYRWPGLIETVKSRFGVGDKKLYWDMLASDHIPFNLFVPLRDQSWFLDLVRGWVGMRAGKLTGMEIEWAPSPNQHFLNDNTSFDAYITYETTDYKLGAIGIETKYTEGPYSWGAAERQRMFDDASLYVVVTRASGMYVDHALAALRTRRLKQVWRNHLLGAAMVQRGLVHEFTSVLMFPADNTHYMSAARAYRELLRPGASARFVAVTFEEHFERCQALCADAPDAESATEWIDYLKRRYIVAI